MTGRARSTKHRLGGAGFYSNLQWSPDSRQVAYTDNAQALYVFDVQNGDAAKKVAAAKVYGPVEQHDVRLVARLALARLHGQHAGAGDDVVGVLDRSGQVVSHQRRAGRGERAGVRSQRQVSLLVRIDRCGPGARLVRAVDG